MRSAGKGRWSWTSPTSGSRIGPHPVVRFGPFDGLCTLLTQAEARSLGQALMAHADAAEGRRPVVHACSANVRAHFGQKTAVDVERLTGRPS